MKATETNKTELTNLNLNESSEKRLSATNMIGNRSMKGSLKSSMLSLKPTSLRPKRSFRKVKSITPVNPVANN